MAVTFNLQNFKDILSKGDVSELEIVAYDTKAEFDLEVKKVRLLSLDAIEVPELESGSTSDVYITMRDSGYDGNSKLVSIITLGKAILSRDCENLFKQVASELTSVMIDVDFRNFIGLDTFFSDMDQLVYLDLMESDLETVETMQQFCADCSALEEVRMGGITANKGKIWLLGTMFGNCPNLRIADISGITSDDTRFLHMIISGCPKIEELNISGLEMTRKVKQMLKDGTYRDVCLSPEYLFAPEQGTEYSAGVTENAIAELPEGFKLYVNNKMREQMIDCDTYADFYAKHVKVV